MVAAAMVHVQLGAEMGALKHVIGHVVEIVAVASETVKAVTMNAVVAVVHAVIIVPVHAQIHVPVPAQGHVLMTVKVLALVIVRGAAIQDVQIVMGVVVVEAAMEVAAMAVILLVIYQLTLKEWRFQWV